MGHKLVLVFEEDSEVNGIDRALVFNNILDAEAYLIGTGKITSIKIEPEDKWFSFKTTAWSGTGRAYWAVNHS